LPPRIPITLLGTLLVGYLLLLLPTFRRIVAAVPQHWLIGVQTFRILGAVFLVRYFAGQLPGLFALPAGIGDVATGLLTGRARRVTWREARRLRAKFRSAVFNKSTPASRSI
jgi:hypothetical protein